MKEKKSFGGRWRKMNLSWRKILNRKNVRIDGNKEAVYRYKNVIKREKK